MTGRIFQQLRAIATDVANTINAENEVLTRDYHAALSTHRKMQKRAENGEIEYTGEEPTPPNIIVVNPEVLADTYYKIIMESVGSRGNPGDEVASPIPGVEIKPLVAGSTSVEGQQPSTAALYTPSGNRRERSANTNERGQVETSHPNASRA